MEVVGLREEVLALSAYCLVSASLMARRKVLLELVVQLVDVPESIGLSAFLLEPVIVGGPQSILQFLCSKFVLVHVDVVDVLGLEEHA